MDTYSIYGPWPEVAEMDYESILAMLSNNEAPLTQRSRSMRAGSVLFKVCGISLRLPAFHRTAEAESEACEPAPWLA